MAGYQYAINPNYYSSSLGMAGKKKRLLTGRELTTDEALSGYYADIAARQSEAESASVRNARQRQLDLEAKKVANNESQFSQDLAYRYDALNKEAALASTKNDLLKESMSNQRQAQMIKGALEAPLALDRAWTGATDVWNKGEKAYDWLKNKAATETITPEEASVSPYSVGDEGIVSGFEPSQTLPNNGWGDWSPTAQNASWEKVANPDWNPDWTGPEMGQFQPQFLDQPVWNTPTGGQLFGQNLGGGSWQIMDNSAQFSGSGSTGGVTGIEAIDSYGVNELETWGGGTTGLGESAAGFGEILGPAAWGYTAGSLSRGINEIGSIATLGLSSSEGTRRTAGGALAGAAVGTAFMPGIGTVIGGLFGALAGGK
jgi:hypothetical protein